MTPHRLQGLYVITDPRLVPDRSLDERVEQALHGGARLLQYRNKGQDGALKVHQVQRLLTLCRRHAVPLIVNDDLALAAQSGADGLHIGRDDVDLASAREALGPGAIIGVSCYDRLDRALEAQHGGADYVAFGSAFPSSIKPHAPRAGLALLRQARAELGIPICAIGGITTRNAHTVIEAGVQMVAVIHAVFGADDPETATRQIADQFL
jgi:thiamine-phosphate pyrophosphorylase